MVADLAPAEQAMRETLGCGAFVDLPADDLEYDLRGAAGVVRARRWGSPGAATCRSSCSNRCAARGCTSSSSRRTARALHHLGFLVDDLDDVVALGAASGFPNVMGGRFGSLRFCYLDTWDALGLYVELVEDPDAMMHGDHAVEVAGADLAAQPAIEKPPSTASVWPVT